MLLAEHGFPHRQTLAVNLLMTVRVQQDAVLDRITAPMCSPLDVMAVPPRRSSKFLVADRTDAILFRPQVPQDPTPF